MRLGKMLIFSISLHIIRALAQPAILIGERAKWEKNVTFFGDVIMMTL